MQKIIAYLTLLRPANALMSCIGVFLGYWISRSPMSRIDLLLLVLSTLCAVGYGNCINDVKDYEADLINHPDRALPRGSVSKIEVILFAAALAIVTIITSLSVSRLHAIAACIPLILLTLYTFMLKATRLTGNIVVSLLVGYTIIFGGLKAPQLQILIIPSFLAFLLTMCREIIKDLQDQKGDEALGVRTTASLAKQSIRFIIIALSSAYGGSITIPFWLHHFHLVYLLFGLLVLLPLHGYWLRLFLVKNLEEARFKTISLLIKIEMMGGLLSMVVDQIGNV